MNKTLKHITCVSVIVVSIAVTFLIGAILAGITNDKEAVENSVVLIKWINEPTLVQERLDRATIELAKDDGEVIGLSSYGVSDCTIWAYDPMETGNTKLMEVLGHEVLHCYKGQYHD